MKIEICANSFASALAAQEAGADRLELCSELSVGGLTPSFGLLSKVTSEISIPVHVLVRPRSGDFTYSDDELDIMLKDIEECRRIGCAGVVSGALKMTQAGKIIIDKQVTSQLISASAGMEFTFHRGFDWVDAPLYAIDELYELGVTRLLTSGQKPTAVQGLELLKEIKLRTATLSRGTRPQMQIMPGGGINATNAPSFLEAGFEAIHFSASRKEQKLDNIPKVPFHSEAFFEEGVVATSDAEKIEALKKAIGH